MLDGFYLMTDYNKGREMWSSLDRTVRALMLDNLGHNVEYCDHDWAALPPQVHNAIIADMEPEPATVPDVTETEKEPEAPRKRKT